MIIYFNWCYMWDSKVEDITGQNWDEAQIAAEFFPNDELIYVGF